MVQEQAVGTRPPADRAVTAWWQAMQDRDIAAIEAAALPDYIGAGMPGGRTLGRAALLAQAREFLGAASIEHWSVTGMAVRECGDVAVCSYEWAERGTAHGTGFSMRGVATDVLVYRDGAWRHQAHHVGMPDGPAG